MSNPIIHLPLEVSFPLPNSVVFDEVEDPFTIPTLAEHWHRFCFIQAETREDVLRDWFILSKISASAVEQVDWWEGEMHAGFIWEFADRSSLAITLYHDSIVRKGAFDG